MSVMRSSSHTLASINLVPRVPHGRLEYLEKREIRARSLTLSAIAAKLRSPVDPTRGAFFSASPSALRSSVSFCAKAFTLRAPGPLDRVAMLIANALALEFLDGAQQGVFGQAVCPAPAQRHGLDRVQELFCAAGILMGHLRQGSSVERHVEARSTIMQRRPVRHRVDGKQRGAAPAGVSLSEVGVDRGRG